LFLQSKIEIVMHLSVSLASISGSMVQKSVEKYPVHQSQDLLTRAWPYQLQSVGSAQILQEQEID